MAVHISLNKIYYTVVEQCTFKNDELVLPSYNKILMLSIISANRRLTFRFMKICSYLKDIMFYLTFGTNSKSEISPFIYFLIKSSNQSIDV
jgi:hypothetical protein